MKRMETTEKVIGENTFYIRPFAAFTAANISGEVIAVLSPVLGGLAPLFGDMGKEEAGKQEVGKKAKAEALGKEAATCVVHREATTAEKTGKGDGPYCKIHRTKGHNLQECHQVG